MEKYFLLLVLPLLQTLVYATEPFPIGARGWGMGNAVVAMPQSQSFFYNPAVLAYETTSSGFAAYHSRFQFSGLGNAAIGATLVTPAMAVGIGGEQFGDAAYHETKGGIALARKQGRVALGLKLSYFLVGMEGVAARGTLLTEFGVMADLRDYLRVGFHGYNLTGAKLFAEQAVPTVLRLGAAFLPSPQVNINAEVEKSTVQPINVKVGMEYRIREWLAIRTGVNSLPRTIHFGVGFSPKQWRFDYAVHTHPALGLSQHFTLTRAFGKAVPTP